MHIVVVGGTGLIGSRVVNRLRDHGAQVRVGSLRTGVNAYTGHGLDVLFDGAEVVVDAMNMNRPAYDYEYDQAYDFFETCARNVLTAEEGADVQHHVGISIIGADDIDSEYFQGKAKQEQLVRDAVTPHSLLRTTLLHEFIPKLVDHVATTHLVRLPPVQVQPTSADDVAKELTRLAIGSPLNGTFELAGPDVHFLDELAREVLAKAGDSRPVMADHAAYYMGAHLAPGTEALLPSWRNASHTFEDWLETTGGSSRSAPVPTHHG